MYVLFSVFKYFSEAVLATAGAGKLEDYWQELVLSYHVGTGK